MIQPTALPAVSILVLNYNSLKHLPDNLGALAALDYPPEKLEIILIDNASTDSSLAWVRENRPNVRIVETGANLGFAGGNNVGAQAATHPWLVVLNPDTRMEPSWLRNLIRPLAENQDLACVASKMLAWDGETLDFGDAAINFMGWGCQPGLGSSHFHDYDAAKDLLFACGGAMLIRRDVFLALGGFDADYMAFFEDVDLGWRLWLQGYQVRFAPEAIVYHRHHGSWDAVASPRIWLLAERNTLSTLIKNYDDDHFARILPAALLLVLQRSWLDADIDPVELNTQPPPQTAVFGWHYYAAQMRSLIKKGDWHGLWQRGQDEMKRRQKPAEQTAAVLEKGPLQHAENGLYQIPGRAISRLLAGKEVADNWSALQKKREAIQSKRQRPDADIFPLFQWELTSNFGDERFIHAMNQVVARFGLTAMFAGETQPLSAECRELSLAVSQQLLTLMTTAVSISQIPPEPFFMSESELPQDTYAVPTSFATLLAEGNTLLWQLPEGDLFELLQWLQKNLAALLVKGVVG